MRDLYVHKQPQDSQIRPPHCDRNQLLEDEPSRFILQKIVFLVIHRFARPAKSSHKIISWVDTTSRSLQEQKTLHDQTRIKHYIAGTVGAASREFAQERSAEKSIFSEGSIRLGSSFGKKWFSRTILQIFCAHVAPRELSSRNHQNTNRLTGIGGCQVAERFRLIWEGDSGGVVKRWKDVDARSGEAAILKGIPPSVGSYPSFLGRGGGSGSSLAFEFLLCLLTR